MHVYVLSNFCILNSDLADPEVIGVFYHRKDATNKLISMINHDEVYMEGLHPTSPEAIIAAIKRVSSKIYHYDDKARDMYWRITRHTIRSNLLTKY